MLAVLLADAHTIGGGVLIALVVALVAAVLVGWVALFFGVPHPLAALLALLVFLLVFFGL